MSPGHTSIDFRNRWQLLSLKSLPTVKLWKLCDPSNFFAASLRDASCSGVIRYARFLRKSSCGLACCSALASLQNGCDGISAPCALSVLERPLLGFGGIMRYEGKK